MWARVTFAHVDGKITPSRPPQLFHLTGPVLSTTMVGIEVTGGSFIQQLPGHPGSPIGPPRVIIAHRNFKVSYLERRYIKALAESQIASWDILRMPGASNNPIGGHGVPTDDDIRAHLGITRPN